MALGSGQQYITNSGEIWYKRGDDYYSEARSMKLDPFRMKKFLIHYGGHEMQEAEKCSWSFREIAESKERKLYTDLRKEEMALMEAIDKIRNSIY